ncbi:MAG: J domain-containing protein [Candidatus Schekmanbacteria bacterium]|nr:J domain-containing protein [Candidatus Schekmanbacteria bacterium]
MDPFLVLGVGLDGQTCPTDEEVEKRYGRLVQLYPPDRAPAQFAVIRRAYELFGDRWSRARLLLMPPEMLAALLPTDDVIIATERPRLQPTELAAVLQQAV